MGKKKLIKLYIVLGVLAVILLLSIFGSGSPIISNYNPDGAPSEKDDGLMEIEYNYDVINELSGGYTGPPKLVASDDKVFYIPPEYCDGSYLKNFRVIGINQSNAKIKRDSNGDVTDYTGAVVLYGFQTTYRADYGAGYDFDYEPYDYDAEYEAVDSYFKDVVLGQGDPEKYEDDESEVLTGADGSSEETSLELYMPGTVEIKENEEAVDDTDFKVATIVMEHEIGKDECKILYCDPDACTVGELESGQYNLVTNLNNSALTVCYNEDIYVYSFDDDESSYGTDEVYYYSVEDLFNSITFKNTLADAGYCNVSYDVKGTVDFKNGSDGWVDVWTGKMKKSNTTNVKNVSYLSNLVGSTAQKDRINSDFINMEQFIKDEIEKAYSGYKKEPSGWLSYEHSTSLESFGDYTYEKNGDNAWTLKNNFKVNLQEKSWLIIFPKTYNGSAEGSVTVNITPDFTLLSEFNYNITDMILTKYDTGDSNKKEYSIILQLMITPVESDEQEDEMEPIEDFDAYVKDINENDGGGDSLPEGVDEDELENMDEGGEDYEDSEEYVERKIGAKYITLNINLAQINGAEEIEDTEIVSISNTAEIQEYFDTAKENYKKEYDTGISVFQKEVKSGPYVVPKDYTVESMNDFKKQFTDIRNTCIELEQARQALADAEAELEEAENNIAENIAETNRLADSLTGEYAIGDKTIGDAGYYRELEDLFEWVNVLFSEDNATGEYPGHIGHFVDIVDRYLQAVKRSVPENSDVLEDIENVKKLTDRLVQIENNPDFNNAMVYSREYYKQLKNGMIDMSEYINRSKSINTDIIVESINLCDEIYNAVADIQNDLQNYTLYHLVNIITRVDSIYEEVIFNYDSMGESVSDLRNVVEVLELIKSSVGESLFNSFYDRTELIRAQNEYIYSTIPECEQRIAELEQRLQELKEKYDNSYFYVDLSWKGRKLDSNALVDCYTEYDAITANVDEYIAAYNKLIDVGEYRYSADTIIEYIRTLNNDSNVNRVIENMYRAVPEESGPEKYGQGYESLNVIYNNRGRYYGDISGAINNLAGIKKVTEATTETTTEENVNIALINEYAESFYDSLSSNMRNERTYSQVMKDCENIYNALYDDFLKVTIQENGDDKEICDITVENVKDRVYTLLLEKYGITELSDYNSDGTVAKTVTLAKNQSSQGNVYKETEATTETTTQANKNDTLSAVYTSYDSLKSYTKDLNSHLKNIEQIAIDKLLGSGVLTEEQQAAMSNKGESIDSDITSDYNLGYKAVCDKVTEINTLLDQAKIYYEVRQDAAGDIRTASSKGLGVEMRDDVYYSYTYRTKCSQADQIYRLLYSAAGARTEEERNKYVEEYNNTDWIVDDIQVEKDLSSAIVISRSYITTTYQKVDWNTSLISPDEYTNVSEEGYELYQMDSNFCIAINDNTAFVVPIGDQADVAVRSLNKKIKDEMGSNFTIENVAYGHDNNNGYDILLFTSDSEWFMIIFKQVDKGVSIDVSNVLGYKGTYDTGDEDTHFLEYDHTTITGLNQLFSTTIENGYKPYSIEAKNGGEIKPEEVNEDGSGVQGVEGAFFNSWSTSDGNVILLGFKQEDMEVVEEEHEGETESETYYEGGTEETTETQYRDIVDTDIYDAHLYVMEYETKPAEGENPKENDSFLDTKIGELYDAGIRLDGPYGELLEVQVNMATVALTVIIALAYTLAVLYSVYLGVKYSKAESDEEHQKVKDHIKWFIIAVISVHILIAFLYLGSRQLKNWTDEIEIISESQTEISTDITTESSDK